MADVISINTRMRPRAPYAPVSKCSASVIIFPGVRYERPRKTASDDDLGSAPIKKKRRGGERAKSGR